MKQTKSENEVLKGQAEEPFEVVNFETKLRQIEVKIETYTFRNWTTKYLNFTVYFYSIFE